MRDIYQETTDRMIEMASQEILPWQKPWSSTGYSFGLPKNGTTNAMYRGINILLLEFAAQQKDYSSHEWGSYNQWKDKGKKVKKGEKSTQIIFFKELQIKEEEDEKKIPVIKNYPVFCADQLEGYEPVERPQPIVPVDSLPHVEEFIKNTGAIIVKGGNQNFYHPREDVIHMVDDDKWIGVYDQYPMQAKYSVTFHELGHWTGPAHRLNRQFGKRFGDGQYAAEEGVAEMSANFIMSALGVQALPSVNSVAYVNGWLPEVLRDKRAIVSVASEASKAADYLFMLQNKADVTGSPLSAPVKPMPGLVP